MILKRIKLNNIRSYPEEEIHFKNGATLLSGDIGCGKTSILLAIEFALFGLQPGQRGGALLRNGEISGGVEIEFLIDNQKIIIGRTLKKTKTVSQNYCSIIIDDKKRELSVTELKNEVLELLNYPKEFSKKQNLLYKFTVYTPQEEMKQIILQDPETRVNTLRHIFGIDKYKKILENTSAITAKIRSEKRVNEILTSNLEKDGLEIESKEKDLEEKQKELILSEKDFEEKIYSTNKIKQELSQTEEKIQEKNKLNTEIEKIKLMILAKKEIIDENEKLLKNIKERIEELEKTSTDKLSKQDVEERIIQFKKQSEKLNEIKINIISEINSINLKTSENLSMEKKFSNLEVCPTCLQNVDAIYRANILNKNHNELSKNKNRIEELEIEKNNTEKKIIEIKEKLKQEENNLTELKILEIKIQEIEGKKKRILEIKNLNESMRKDIAMLKSHSDTLSESMFELGRHDQIFQNQKYELETTTKKERMSEIKMFEFKKEISMLSQQIKEMKAKIEKLHEIRNKLSYLTELEDWLVKKFIPMVSTVERNVMIRLKSEFSEFFEKWFKMLVSDSFNVRLDNQFTPIIEQQDYETEYAYLSGGERTAIALAYRLALNQIINSSLGKIKTKDLVILDEPTDGFSNEQLSKMREVLDELNMEQLIIVSHEPTMENFVEHIKKIKKINGISLEEN